jgi:hypothetical protein
MQGILVINQTGWRRMLQQRLPRRRPGVQQPAKMAAGAL